MADDIKFDTTAGTPSESIESAIPHRELLSPQELEAMGLEIEGDTSQPIKDASSDTLDPVPEKPPVKEPDTPEKPAEDPAKEKPGKPEVDLEKKDDPPEDIPAKKEETPPAEKEEDTPAEELSTPLPQKPLITMMDIVPPEEVESLKAAMDQAKTDVDNGDIEQEEYSDAKYAYKSALHDNAKADSFNAKQMSNLWEYDRDNFYAQNPTISENRTLKAAMTVLMKEHDATPEGKELSNIALLDWAKTQAMKDMGITSTVPDKSGDEKKKALDDAKKKKADRSDLGEDIQNVPIAQQNEADNGDQFAYLDRLEGDVYQTAVDKLTPAQRLLYEDAH